MPGDKETERDSHVVDLSLTQDGHHGPAIDAAMKDILQDDYGKSVTEHRVPRKVLRIPFGRLVVPPGGLTFQSMPNLKIRGGGIGAFAYDRPSGSCILGRGPMDAVVTLDGVLEGEMTGVTVIGERVKINGRDEAPANLVVAKKSIPNPFGTPMHDLDLDIQCGGWWRHTAARLGNPEYSTAQEDNFRGRIRVIGGYDALEADQTDWCLRGVFCGNHQWGNDRRHNLTLVKVQRCRTAVWCEKTGVDIQYLTADGCLEVMSVAGTVGQVVVHGGEAESCARLLVEQQYQRSDFAVSFRDFAARLDTWRPAITGNDNYDLYFGSYGGGGGLLLDRVQVTHLPVRRAANGQLYYVKHVYQDATGKVAWQWTDVPAPKFLLRHDHTYLKTEALRVWGYRQAAKSSEVFDYERGAWARHEAWSDRLVDGQLEGDWEKSDFVHTTGMTT